MASRKQLLDEPEPRRFQLYRREDVNGASGTGIVAEGMEFRDGAVAYRWLTAPGTLQYAESIDGIGAVEHIHGHNGRTTVRWLDDEQHGGEEKTISEVYEDRNLLAVSFALLAHDHPAPAYGGGYHLDDGDDADADEWAIVWATTPEGQVSWHVPRDLAENSDLHLRNIGWDGHNRKEKNERLYTLLTDA